MFKGVSLDQAPPFEAPLKFFITAILFGIVAGAALVIKGDDVGVLHLFTLGVMNSIMIGALLQMLPVVVGVRFPNPKLLSHLILWPYIAGITLFVMGFWLSPYWLFVAAVLLLFSLGLFASVTFWRLLQAPKFSPTVTAMIGSTLFFMIVVALGGYMLTSLALGKNQEGINLLAAIHGSFALLGWVGLLIMGVSFQVIPMFYVTTEPKRKIAYALVASTTALLPFTPFFSFASLALTPLFMLYALWMAYKLFKRKRKIKEPSIILWYFGLFSLFVSALLYFWGNSLFTLKLFIFGFAISIMIGMLYKIIPFLVWFHTSSRGFFDVPTMREMIDEKVAYAQIIFHVTSILALLSMPKIAGIFAMVSFMLLFYLLQKPIKIYFIYKKKPSPFEKSYAKSSI